MHLPRPVMTAAALVVLASVALPLTAGEPRQRGSVAASQPGGGVRATASDKAPPLGANAALTYYRVWSSVSEGDWKAVNEQYPGTEFGKPLPESLHRVLESNRGQIEQLIKCSSMKHCDFGLDYSEGFAMLLPHLSKMRSAVRLLAADARRCVAEGKLDEAADRYAAVFGVARHAGSDRVVISSLVSVAVACVPHGDLVEQKGAAMLTAAGRAKVLAAIEKMNGAEGFGLKNALLGERDLAIDGTIAKYDGPDAGRRFEAECLRIMGDPSGSHTGSGNEQAMVEKIRQMDGAALQAEARKLDPFYAACVKAWDSPDAVARLEELAEKAKGDEYGLLGRSLLPALSKCRQSQDKGTKTMAEIAAALRKADQAENQRDGKPSK